MFCQSMIPGLLTPEPLPELVKKFLGSNSDLLIKNLLGRINFRTTVPRCKEAKGVVGSFSQFWILEVQDQDASMVLL